MQFDDNILISGGKNGLLHVYDLRTGKIRHSKQFNSSITSLQFEFDTLIISTEKIPPCVIFIFK